MFRRLTTFISCWILILSLASAELRYYWRDYTGKVPDDAFIGAPNLYIAQVVYNNGILPATFYPNSKEAVTEANTKRVSLNYALKILCDVYRDNFEWEFIHIDSVTGNNSSNLVIGGYELDTTLYIGKAFHEGQWKIGKVFPPSSQYKGLRIWSKNNEVFALQDFQILKYNDKGDPALLIDIRGHE